MKYNITRAEMEVLKALWKTGTGTVREIADHLPQKDKRAYTTLQTLLKRLEDKNIVTRSKDEQPHVYAARVTRQGLMKARLAKELESFQGLIDKLDREEDEQ